jgi:hypothetical protein
MEIVNRPKEYYSFDKCKELALSCKTRTEFLKSYNSAYHIASDNGWLDKICETYEVIRTPKGYWTKILCLDDASKYSRPSDWKKNSGSAYSVALRNGWLAECTAHMQKKIKNN